MQLLFPSKVNAKKGVATVEDFQPLRKREKVVADLRYLGNYDFQLKSSLVRDLEVNQGWTCSFDAETGKTYMVLVETNPDIPARFCVKTEGKKTITTRFKAQILVDALGFAIEEKNFFLNKIVAQPIEGITLYEIVSASDDVEVEEELEAEEIVLTDEPEKVEEAKVFANPFASQFAQVNAELDEQLM